MGWPATGYRRRPQGIMECGGGNSVSQVDLDSGMVAAGWFCGRRALQRKPVLNASEKMAPPALALMPDNSVPPSTFKMPFELLPQCWSQSE